MSEQLLVCESCGVEFPPSAEVQSSRVLCAPCLAKRRAELRAARESGGGPAKAPAGAAKPAAPRPPAAAAKPAAPRAAATREGRPSRDDGGRGERGEREHHHEHVDLRKAREERQARLMKIGWIVSGSMLLVTGLVLWFVSAERTAKKNEEAAYQESLNKFRDDMIHVDVNSEDRLKEARDRITKERKLWKGTRIEGDVSTQQAKINDAITTLGRTRSFKERLEAIEKQLTTDAASATLAKLFTDVRDSELALQANEFGGDLKARHERALKEVVDRHVAALRSAADGATQATTPEGLAPLGELEDALRVIIEGTAAGDVDAAAKWKPQYAKAVADSNQAVTRLFDDAFIEKVARKDLLADTAGWTAVASGSFTYKFGSGLTLTNGAGDGAASGGLSYTAGNHWRDYVLDLEVKLDSGNLGIYTRIDTKMDSNQVPAFVFGTKSHQVLADYGKPTTMQIKVVGNVLTVKVDNAVVHHDDIKMSKSRKGEPGLVALIGTTATVTKLQARVLR